METEKLNYYLPKGLIAQQPVEVRSDSKLLVLERSKGELTDNRFYEIGRFLKAEDCLILNDTKVIAARFFVRRVSGAKLEGIFLRQLPDGTWEVMLKNARRVKAGEHIYLTGHNGENFCSAQVVKRLEGRQWLLKIDVDKDSQAVLNQTGFVPLPPYIKRNSEAAVAGMDKERYQTVFARHPGAIAAPTAGLHFTEELMRQLKNDGIRFAYITLHVGLGTFKPINTKNIEQHEMDCERFSIDEKNVEIINAVKQTGGRVIAVGTTVVRTLETVAANGKIKPTDGSTKLFIRPGYRFKVVDAMITNFHLPKSTLLALVAAFAGLDKILNAYRHAIEKKYRFYSYGDAMLIV